MQEETITDAVETISEMQEKRKRRQRTLNAAAPPNVYSLSDLKRYEGRTLRLPWLELIDRL